ncbi:hypothetical protein D6779_03150 [Candidatus Parcubacteria bacterium]|nr:MAG: hypothetical protein D6779_03150 [Candidatus Parcubacteria bacterium]
MTLPYFDNSAQAFLLLARIIRTFIELNGIFASASSASFHWNTASDASSNSLASALLSTMHNLKTNVVG